MEEIKQEQNETMKSGAPEASRTPPEQAENREDFQSLIRGRYREEYLRHAAALLAEQAERTNRYQAYCALKRQAEDLRQTYPDFDLNRELENPTFLRLIGNQIDPATAYEAVHRRELAEEAARRARIERHPMENGLNRAAPAVLRADPRALTRQERKQLRRRAARGEEIVW